jgi:hypothetical protein
MNPVTSELVARAARPIEGAVVNPRRHLRFSVAAAEADVTTLRSGRHLLAGLSEVSPRGCYLDTPEAFVVGTEVRVRIRYAGDSCELPGTVIYAHKGWGMGVLFGDAAAGQSAVLDRWLAELARKASCR